MISGRVNSYREAVIEFPVLNAEGQPLMIEAVIDTGFNGGLALPRALIERLGLPWRRRGRATLADGSDILFDVHEGMIVWDGERRRVAVDAVDGDALVGMSLLFGHELLIEVTPDGQVTIKPLNQSAEPST